MLRTPVKESNSGPTTPSTAATEPYDSPPFISTPAAKLPSSQVELFGPTPRTVRTTKSGTIMYYIGTDGSPIEVTTANNVGPPYYYANGTQVPEDEYPVSERLTFGGRIKSSKKRRVRKSKKRRFRKSRKTVRRGKR